MDNLILSAFSLQFGVFGALVILGFFVAIGDIVSRIEWNRRLTKYHNDFPKRLDEIQRNKEREIFRMQLIETRWMRREIGEPKFQKPYLILSNGNVLVSNRAGEPFGFKILLNTNDSFLEYIHSYKADKPAHPDHKYGLFTPGIHLYTYCGYDDVDGNPCHSPNQDIIEKGAIYFIPEKDRNEVIEFIVACVSY